MVLLWVLDCLFLFFLLSLHFIFASIHASLFFTYISLMDYLCSCICCIVIDYVILIQLNGYVYLLLRLRVTDLYFFIAAVCG